METKRLNLKIFNQNQTNYSEDEQTNTIEIEKRSLVLHNDDYHTFDYVIESLIEICKHNPEQAIQCTYLIHYKGKCDVKNGTYELLKPMKEALIEKGLNATIN